MCCIIFFREENDVVPKVVEAILNLPPNTHIAVRHTSLLLLGELCEWIEKHPQSLGKYYSNNIFLNVFISVIFEGTGLGIVK